MNTTQTVQCPLRRHGGIDSCRREPSQHKSKFCSLTTCNHLTADSPSLSLAWFQTMPTHKTSHSQSESFSRSPTCSLKLAGVQPPRGANLWKTLRPPKNVTMVNETERERGRGRKQTNTLYSPWALSRQTSQMLNGTGFWLLGDYFCLSRWQTVCVKTNCQRCLKDQILPRCNFYSNKIENRGMSVNAAVVI